MNQASTPKNRISGNGRKRGLHKTEVSGARSRQATRRGRKGVEQVHLGLWIDKQLFERLEEAATLSLYTVSEAVRELLREGLDAWQETKADEAVVLLQRFLTLSTEQRNYLWRIIQRGRR